MHIDVECSPLAPCWAGVTIPSVWAGLAGGWRAACPVSGAGYCRYIISDDRRDRSFLSPLLTKGG